MRRHEKEILDRSVLEEILEACHVGRLGTLGADGYPRIKPLNFVHANGRIYFHTAKEGEKIEDILRNPRVCFEVDQPLAYVRARSQACEAGYLYRSVLVRGRARMVEDLSEKRRALDALMVKYQPEGDHGDMAPARLRGVGVVCIEVEEIRGKEGLGEGSLRETALRIVSAWKAPANLDRDGGVV